MGASGGIGGTYGYMPELFLRLEELIESGDILRAKALQQDITAIIYDTFRASSLYAAAKGILALRGLECGSVRAPFLPLVEKDEPIIRELYDKIQATAARYAD